MQKALQDLRAAQSAAQSAARQLNDAELAALAALPSKAELDKQQTAIDACYRASQFKATEELAKPNKATDAEYPAARLGIRDALARTTALQRGNINAAQLVETLRTLAKDYRHGGYGVHAVARFCLDKEQPAEIAALLAKHGFTVPAGQFAARSEIHPLAWALGMDDDAARDQWEAACAELEEPAALRRELESKHGAVEPEQVDPLAYLDELPAVAFDAKKHDLLFANNWKTQSINGVMCEMGETLVTDTPIRFMNTLSAARGHFEAKRDGLFRLVAVDRMTGKRGLLQ